MELLFVIPNGTPQTSGNWVTAQRIARGIKIRHFKVQVLEVDQARQLIDKVDLVHCFHAYKSGLLLKELLWQTRIPYVVSFTGTDLQQLKEKNRSAEAIEFINCAQRAVVFHEEAKLEAVAVGIPEDTLVVINQAAAPLHLHSIDPVALRKSWGVGTEEIVFLLAGGIRPVKGVLKALDLMSSLHQKHPQVRLIMIGPILDYELGEVLKRRLQQLSWASYQGQVPHEQMGSALEAADVVINTSLSEGMPNTLLEAIYMGKPVLASDVSGNRAIVKQGINGYIYKSSKEFFAYGSKLIKDQRLGAKLGKHQSTKYQLLWEQEIKAYESIYKQIATAVMEEK